MVIFSPTHKRTEGRAPCGALSLLQKDAALQGGSSRIRCRLNVKLRTSVTACFFTAYYHPIPFRIYINLREQFRFLAWRRSQKRSIFEGQRMNQPALQPYRTRPWGPVARLYTPRSFKQPTKSTLKVGGAGQNFSDFTPTSKKFPDIVHHLKNVAENI